MKWCKYQKLAAHRERSDGGPWRWWLAINHYDIWDEFYTLNGRWNPRKPWNPDGLYRRMWR